MNDESARVRPSGDNIGRRPRRVEAGSFRTRNEPPSPHHRVAIEVAYAETAIAHVIRAELTQCYHLALAELDRRFHQDDRR